MEARQPAAILQDDGLRTAFYHSAQRYDCTTSHRAAAAPKLTKTQNSPRGLLPPFLGGSLLHPFFNLGPGGIALGWTQKTPLLLMLL